MDITGYIFEYQRETGCCNLGVLSRRQDALPGFRFKAIVEG